MCLYVGMRASLRYTIVCLYVGMRASLRYTYCVFVCWYACFSEVYLLCVCMLVCVLRYTFVLL